VLVHEYAHALLERGYLVVEVDWPEDECEPDTSKSEDSEPGGSMSDGGSSCDEVFAASTVNVTWDEEVDVSIGLLDDVIMPDYDWVGSSRRSLGEMGLNFDELQDWLGEKKRTYANPNGANLDAGEVASIVTRDQLLAVPGMDQRAVFDYIVGKVESNKHFNVILQGPAGCGKSYLYAALKTKLGTKILFAAPTGVAAVLIMGETVHSLFGINPKSKQLLPLKNLADRQKMFGGRSENHRN